VIVIERKTRTPSVPTAHSCGACRAVETKIDFEALGMNVTWLYGPKHNQEEKKDTENAKPFKWKQKKTKCSPSILEENKIQQEKMASPQSRDAASENPTRAKLQKQGRYTKIDTKGNSQ
jgi:hypothetical protein